jgi:hypothetical protein
LYFCSVLSHYYLTRPSPQFYFRNHMLCYHFLFREQWFKQGDCTHDRIPCKVVYIFFSSRLDANGIVSSNRAMEAVSHMLQILLHYKYIVPGSLKYISAWEEVAYLKNWEAVLFSLNIENFAVRFTFIICEACAE